LIASPKEDEKEPEAKTQKQDENVNNSPGCTKHFGYLSERAANVPIPDDCLTCKDIVQCMRKKAKD
jgi:hypothetical protein